MTTENSLYEDEKTIIATRKCFEANVSVRSQMKRKKSTEERWKNRTAVSAREDLTGNENTADLAKS